uniref:Uncharacterized protein n=1 Tax=Anopheles farauti TaxID=69004 RepID=A0A182QVD6_9DIPT
MVTVVQVGVVLPQDVVLERFEHRQEEVQVALVQRIAANERAETEVYHAVHGTVQIRLQLRRQRLRWFDVHEPKLDRVRYDRAHVTEAGLRVHHQEVHPTHQIPRSRHVASKVLLDHAIEHGKVRRQDVELDQQVRDDGLHPLEEVQIVRELVVHLGMRHHVHHVPDRFMAHAHRIDRADPDHRRLEQLRERVHRRKLVVLHDHHVEVRVPAVDQPLHVRMRQFRLQEQSRHFAQLHRDLIEVHIALLHVHHIQILFHYPISLQSITVTFGWSVANGSVVMIVNSWPLAISPFMNARYTIWWLRAGDGKMANTLAPSARAGICTASTITRNTPATHPGLTPFTFHHMMKLEGP